MLGRLHDAGIRSRVLLPARRTNRQPQEFPVWLVDGRPVGGSRKALAQLRPEFVPGNGGVGIGPVLSEPEVELFLLSFRQLERLRLSRNAVPQILNELEPLGDTQMQQVGNGDRAHESSLHRRRPLAKPQVRRQTERQEPSTLSCRKRWVIPL